MLTAIALSVAKKFDAYHLTHQSGCGSRMVLFFSLFHSIANHSAGPCLTFV